MIVYKDRTFCNSRHCTNKKCEIRLTSEIYKKAEKLGLKVSVSDFHTLCKDLKLSED
jgi:hypothetical protein